MGEEKEGFGSKFRRSKEEDKLRNINYHHSESQICHLKSIFLNLFHFVFIAYFLKNKD